MNSDDKYTALVTGFGPFDNHVINASWEAVKELSNLSATSEQLKDVKVIVKEIPVSYDGVVDNVSKLWNEYKPTVILHVGVSKIARCLTIEGCARSNGYIRPDIHNKCPDENDVPEKILKSGINVNKVCDIVNTRSQETKCKACVSYDAGRYLCEYIFYKSLEIEPMKTLFVHVPDLDTYSSVQTAKGLHDVLCYLIESVRNHPDEGQVLS